MLPVRQVGSIIAKGTLTEEVNEVQHTPIWESNIHDHNRTWFYTYADGSNTVSDAAFINFLHALADEALIKWYHLDVLLQPPNAA